MHKRLWIVSLVVFVSLCGLALLGLHSIGLHAEGLQDRRNAEFTEVAEQIRIDIKRKLDAFIITEQNRPYTDYQPYYIPETIGQSEAILPSPLADKLSHNLAFGHFQIEADGTIITPFSDDKRGLARNDRAQTYITNIENNLLVALNGNGPTSSHLNVQRVFYDMDRAVDKEDMTQTSLMESAKQQKGSVPQAQAPQQRISLRSKKRGENYMIQSLEGQKSKVISQRRSNVAMNIDNIARVSQLRQRSRSQKAETPMEDSEQKMDQSMGSISMNQMLSAQREIEQAESESKDQDQLAANRPSQQKNGIDKQSDTVQIRIEPFIPKVVAAAKEESAIFPGQIFLLRHVQIEEKHFLQGFRLDEAELISQITESAQRLVRAMSFEIAKDELPDATYTAILDFGFGQMALNLFELDPDMIPRQIARLKGWYLSIIVVVFLAVTFGLTSLWRNVSAQLKLAQKKDDFISAVSHELRTPLTTIRMYTEMLEKGWVKTEDKRNEYYTTMRQESERLSRLIENVLDFSRIQRGRKKYSFVVGDINKCVDDVVEMMIPYAKGAGFTITKQYSDSPETRKAAFDSDAVMQIVINLLDNAIKYARDAADKTIIVRTAGNAQHILIEVEDHGPGIPGTQRKKIFDEFYRIGNESTRETTGTGLGLALVKRFALAHNGFVEILNAKPMGAVFRVGLAVQS